MLVDYLCPNCNSRIGTSRPNAYGDPLEKVRCHSCRRTFRFHDALLRPNAHLLKGVQPTPPVITPNVRVPAGTGSGTNTNVITIPAFSLSQGSTLIVAAMDTNTISDPATTVACVWNAQNIPIRLDYFPVNFPGSLFGPRLVMFEANNLSAGTSTAVITWTGDPVIGQINAFATELKVGSSPDNSIGTNDASSTTPNADIAGDPVQAQEIFIGSMASFGNATDLANASTNNCSVGQSISQSGSSIIELVRTDSGIQAQTQMGLTNYNPPTGRLWSMIVADFKIP